VLPDGTHPLTIPGAGEYYAFQGNLDIRNYTTINGTETNTTIMDGRSIDCVLEVVGAGR